MRASYCMVSARRAATQALFVRNSYRPLVLGTDGAILPGCYLLAGATFGTVVASPATPAIILACNAGLGICMATMCAPLLLIPCL